MSAKMLFNVILLTALIPNYSKAEPLDITTFCGKNIETFACDEKKLQEFKKITKNTDAANVNSYSEKQKVFFKSIENHCGELQDTCQALIQWQRAAEPERAPASKEDRLGLWGIAFTLIGLYLLYKGFMKGVRLAFTGLSRGWNAMDSGLGRDIRNTEQAHRSRNSLANDTDPDYFANDKQSFDFGYGNSESSPRQESSSSSGSTITQWRVEGHYSDQKSYTLHFQINADSAESARAQVRRDKKNFVILKVSRY